MAAAARNLKITSAAISKHIFSLESALDIQLLKRTTRHIELTAEGAVYYDHAKRILESFEEAEAAVSHSKNEPTGTLKLVCGPEIGNLYVIPALEKFLERYPKLRLQIVLTQMMTDVERENV